MRSDFDNIKDGAYVILHPNERNPLHSKPVRALHQSGYFYCDGSPVDEGPDYYFRDVREFNVGFTDEAKT